MNDEAAPECVRCGRPVVANRALYETLERMHWLCFHLEFEHPGDPDVPCTDPSCRVWQLEAYRSALREAGLDPDTALERAIVRRYTRERDVTQG